MKPPKPNQPAQPKRHTIAYRPGWIGNHAFCTTCGKDIDYKDINKRCKGGSK